MRHVTVTASSAVCLILSATYAVCASDDGDRSMVVQSKLTKSINEFGLTLYKAISKSVSGDNICLSPSSISTALAMVYVGARGNTRTQMTSAMYLDVYDSSDESAVKRDFKELIQTLSISPQINYTLDIANCLFGQLGYNFTNEYLQDTETYFRAVFEALDFRNTPTDSRVRINGWVTEQTSGKIRDLLPEGSITVLTRLVLVNAIFFKGLWVNQFDKEATKPETFHLSDSEDTKIDMMQLGRRRLNYYNSTELGCEVLELPYVGNLHSSMFVLLPHSRSLSSVEGRLGADSLDMIFSGLQSVDAKVSLPRFAVDHGVSLSDFLKAIGIVDLFDSTKADLSGIDGTRNLFVSSVIHKAFVEVNEEGTEAAASTAVILGRRNRLPKLIHFNADRPFLFFIAEKTTRSILFLGRLAQPQKQDIKNSASFPGKLAEQRCCQGSGYTNSSSTSILISFHLIGLQCLMSMASIGIALLFFVMHD